MSNMTTIGGGYSPEQIELIKRTICKGATDDELAMFLMVCNRCGLDPFSKQIHAVKRWNNKTQREEMSMQTGIDGFRLIAERTGKYAGNDDPVYDSEDGQHPQKATVTVWKIVGGQRVPFTKSARWSEFVQTKKDGSPTQFWQRMPYLMLGKVAEALALRTAFPQELSGLYTTEEMGQADNDGVQEVEIVAKPTQRPQLPARKSVPDEPAATSGQLAGTGTGPSPQAVRDGLAAQIKDAQTEEEVRTFMSAADQQHKAGVLSADDMAFLRTAGYGTLLKLADTFQAAADIGERIDKAESNGLIKATQADYLRKQVTAKLNSFPADPVAA